MNIWVVSIFFLAIMNNAAVNICVQINADVYFHFFWVDT